MGVDQSIVDALSGKGITSPFPIQDMAIPLALTGTDLIAQARTGTGKTLAFGVPLLQRIVTRADSDYDELEAPGKPQALVIAPTRELASQVSDDISVAGKIRQARVLTVYGGTGYDPQLDALASGVDVVVGTPGRLLDLMDRGALDLRHVKILVLDEADRMLDLGFLDDVERLIARTHELRQTMLFSATMPGDIVGLARRHLRHPVNIRAESGEDSQMVPATAQFVYQTHDLDKPEVIARILQAESTNLVIVFCQTKRQCQRLTDDLRDRGFAAAAIHGDLTQVAREKNLERFRNGNIDVLVATDVAARGIDVEGVTHVINYSCTDDEKTYLHRIGRTGRAGLVGDAVSLVCVDEEHLLRDVERMLGHAIPSQVVPGFEPDRSIRAEPIRLRTGQGGGGQHQHNARRAAPARGGRPQPARRGQSQSREARPLSQAAERPGSRIGRSWAPLPGERRRREGHRSGERTRD